MRRRRGEAERISCAHLRIHVACAAASTRYSSRSLPGCTDRVPRSFVSIEKCRQEPSAEQKETAEGGSFQRDSEGKREKGAGRGKDTVRGLLQAEEQRGKKSAQSMGEVNRPKKDLKVPRISPNGPERVENLTLGAENEGNSLLGDSWRCLSIYPNEDYAFYQDLFPLLCMLFCFAS